MLPVPQRYLPQRLLLLHLILRPLHRFLHITLHAIVNVGRGSDDTVSDKIVAGRGLASAVACMCVEKVGVSMGAFALSFSELASVWLWHEAWSHLVAEILPAFLLSCLWFSLRGARCGISDVFQLT